MSLQSERLLGHMQRLRLSHLPACYETLAEEAAGKNLPYLDFLEQLLESESQAKHSRNVRLKTQWAHFPYLKGLDQFDFDFQPSIEERKVRELAGLAFLERKENVWAKRIWPLLSEQKRLLPAIRFILLPYRTWCSSFSVLAMRIS